MHAAIRLELDQTVSGGILDGREVDRRLRAARLVRAEHRRQVEVGEHVPVQHHDPAVDQVRGVPHAPRRAERVALDNVPQAHRAEILLGHDRADRLRPVGDGEDHVAHAVRAEHRELVGEKRDVQQRHDRLRPLEGQRPEPRSQPSGQDHGLYGHDGPSTVRSGPSPRGAPSRRPR
jgi:hypothetical protein